MTDVTLVTTACFAQMLDSGKLNLERLCLNEKSSYLTRAATASLPLNSLKCCAIMASEFGTARLISEARDDAIGQALTRCTWFVIILSPGAVDSMWVKNELLFALNQRRYRDRIAPVLYKKCKYEKLSWTLSSFQIVDFTQSIEGGYRELLRMWDVNFETNLKKTRAAPKRKS